MLKLINIFSCENVTVSLNSQNYNEIGLWGNEANRVESKK